MPQALQTPLATSPAAPLTIRMHASDNVAIVANDGGLPVAEGFDVSLFATNITKKKYIISNTGTFQSIGAQSVMYGEPRMFGIRFRYSFGD